MRSRTPRSTPRSPDVDGGCTPHQILVGAATNDSPNLWCCQRSNSRRRTAGCRSTPPPDCRSKRSVGQRPISDLWITGFETALARLLNQQRPGCAPSTNRPTSGFETALARLLNQQRPGCAPSTNRPTSGFETALARLLNQQRPGCDPSTNRPTNYGSWMLLTILMRSARRRCCSVGSGTGTAAIRSLV